MSENPTGSTTSFNDMMSIRVPLEHARHLPGEYYGSKQVFEAEKNRLFMKDWVCVGRAEEIEAPGDFFTFDIVGEPIVVARCEDGTVAAFSNLCLHRGVEVAEGRGNTRKFSCPYHAWAYGLDGRLLGAPHMKETADFRPETCRLPEVHVGQWEGWLFVSLAANPLPFDEFIGPFAQEFTFLGLGRCRHAERLTFDLDCNWKFVAENFLDIYHAMVVHAGSFGKYRDAVDYFPNDRGQASVIGYYNSAPLVPTGVSLFGNMPWLADKPANFACLGHLAPNFQLFGRSDNAVVHLYWPLSRSKTRLVSYILFPEEHFAQADFRDKVAVYRDFLTQIVEEDRPLVISLQRAVECRRFVPGRLSRLEHGLYNLINYQLERLFGPDLDGGQTPEAR